LVYGEIVEAEFGLTLRGAPGSQAHETLGGCAFNLGGHDLPAVDVQRDFAANAIQPQVVAAPGAGPKGKA
jgi:hypothetical protein